MAKGLWNVYGGEPWMVNPGELAVWNPRRKTRRRRKPTTRRRAMTYGNRRRRRRRRTRARRRRNVYEYGSVMQNRRRRRRRRPVARRRRYARRRRRNVYDYVGVPFTNVRRRRRRAGRRRRRRASARRRRGFFGGGGGIQGDVMAMFDPNAILAGVGSALAIGLAVPWVARQFPQVQTNPMVYRGAQAGVAIATAVLLRQMGVVDRRVAVAVGSYGVVFAVMGLIKDYGVLEQLGLPMSANGMVSPAGVAAMTPALTGMGYLDPSLDTLGEMDEFGARVW